jgi:hypothetical protein
MWGAKMKSPVGADLDIFSYRDKPLRYVWWHCLKILDARY